MTTPDSKYKHKPSEKHTLEEVLKSLQDLIRNDLLDNDQSAVSTETPPAAGLQPKDKPDQERIVSKQEDFASTGSTAGTVNLDAVMRSLNDLIGNELNVGGQLAPAETAPATSSFKQQDEAASNSEQLPSPKDQPALEEPDEFIVGAETTYSAESTILLPEPPISQIPAPEEFIPLDEELGFDESTEIASLPPAESTIPDPSGANTPKLLIDPEELASPQTPQLEPENRIAPKIQQELLLDESPLIISAPSPVALDTVPRQEPTAPAIADIVPDDVTGVSAENAKKTAEESLPTIEVEETFDAGAYFETEPQPTEPPLSEAQEIQEIIASALDTPRASENFLPALQSGSGEIQSNNLTPLPESDKTPPNNAIDLGKLEKPAVESYQDSFTVDFDTIDIDLPYTNRDPSPQTSDTRGPSADVTSPAAFEQPVTLGTRSESDPQLEVPVSLDSTVAAGDARKQSRETLPTEVKPLFNLDDIPVLNEVVAPPAGSTLMVDSATPVSEPPLPTPDRARDIVVRAVAKLNVEMRKTGVPGLDTKVILRLQQLIRQELEKDSEKS
ncbi:MAG: hypothetical protein ACYC9J_10540 [Sulfuricaulis sp.]